jgi:hypothetical protein
VTGPQWGITVEHNPTGPKPWAPSRHPLADFRIQGGQFKFDILTDDSAGDEDFNDLVLTCDMPLSSSEYVVYGSHREWRHRPGQEAFRTLNAHYALIEGCSLCLREVPSRIQLELSNSGGLL